MTVFGVRVFLFSILPLLLAAGILLLDRSASTRERRLEVPLILLFGLGVAASGIGSFFGHLFLSDDIADSVGWPRGSPFQQEMAFANLAVGILGIVAAGRRDGFREATVIAVTVLGVGASVVHLVDVLATGNMSPGNTIQNVANLIKPAFLIPLLIASRRAERSPRSDARTPQFELWRTPLLQTVAFVTAIVSTAFAVGFAVRQTLLLCTLGTIAAAAVTAVILGRSPAHRPLSETHSAQEE
jgi:4-amino-4-deoxy-L-arabinose transferase-like glycosyltransferase